MRRLALAVLAAALCLLVPASAWSQVGGSSLASPADYPSDCRDQLIAVGFQGYSVYSNQQPSCTWWQTGVFGSIDAGDRLKGYVPGNGTITSISVRSGPNPAPLRFVVARQLTPVFLGAPDLNNQACCFFVREAGPFQPAANTTSTFAVNLPVESNRTPTEVTNDIIGFSAASGTGTLPLHVIPGQFTPSAFLVSGTLDAAAVWPALGADPNDGAGGRRPTGIAGIEVLLQYTMGPAGGGSAPGGGGGGPVTPVLPPAVGIPTSKLKAADGRVALKVRCIVAGNCKGTVKLKTRKGKSLGSKRVNIATGRTATVRVKLNKLGRKLAKRKRVKVVATVDLGAAGVVNKKLTLKRPPRS